MEAAWRLVWALPLVLVIGLLAVVLLRRFIAPLAPAASTVRRLQACEVLPLSDDTRVHLLHVEGRAYLLVESTRHTVLQSVAAASSATSLAARPAPRWLQWFQQTRAR